MLVIYANRADLFVAVYIDEQARNDGHRGSTGESGIIYARQDQGFPVPDLPGQTTSPVFSCWWECKRGTGVYLVPFWNLPVVQCHSAAI